MPNAGEVDGVDGEVELWWPEEKYKRVRALHRSGARKQAWLCQTRDSKAQLRVLQFMPQDALADAAPAILAQFRVGCQQQRCLACPGCCQ